MISKKRPHDIYDDVREIRILESKKKKYIESGNKLAASYCRTEIKKLKNLVLKKYGVVVD